MHLPLNKITYPAHLQELFEGLIKVVQFDLLDQIPFDLPGPETTPTIAFSKNFEGLGYESQNTYDNLGFTNVLIGMLLLETLVVVLTYIPVPATCVLVRKVRDKYRQGGVQMSTLYIRFFL